MAEFRIGWGRRSLRILSYDYAAAGWYYITVCLQNRRCLFGAIRDGEMQLNHSGRIAGEEWLRSLEIRPGLEFDQWVIMPNHLHAIVVLPYSNARLLGRTAVRPY